jgi:hypothetical protein
VSHTGVPLSSLAVESGAEHGMLQTLLQIGQSLARWQPERARARCALTITLRSCRVHRLNCKS